MLPQQHHERTDQTRRIAQREITQNFLIRFKGGCGGETVGRLLAHAIDGKSMMSGHDDRNRAIDIGFDTFDGQLLQDWPSDRDVTDLQIPEMPWSEQSDADIRRYVNVKRFQHADRVVGLAHYCLPPNCDYQYSFANTIFLDIMPREEQFLLVHALHLYKAACKKIFHLPNWSHHSGYAKMQEHFRSHGWIPSWWMWDDTDDHDFIAFIEKRGLPNMSILPTIASSSDLMIDGGEIVIDADMHWFGRIETMCGIALDRDICRNWVRRNQQIIDALGLSPYTRMHLSVERQREILKETFAKRIDRMLYGPEGDIGA